MWQAGVDAIWHGEQPVEVERHTWYPWISRTPIVILGSAGAGKTEIWRKLTGRDAPDAPSTGVDEGYFFPIGHRRRSVTITTIPGQISSERYDDLHRLFGPDTKLSGVIFVASFGFDHIWPNEADTVAHQLSPFEIESLSERNIRRELNSFHETCEHIKQKFVQAAWELTPRWFLVLVNKADLYWDAIDVAESYYLPYCDSPFDQEAQALREQLGGLAQFHYEVLPITLRPGDYEFVSNRGRLSSPAQLGVDSARASLVRLVRSLEELSGV